jgi:hypothetical protein
MKRRAAAAATTLVAAKKPIATLLMMRVGATPYDVAAAPIEAKTVPMTMMKVSPARGLASDLLHDVDQQWVRKDDIATTPATAMTVSSANIQRRIVLVH